MSQIDLLNQADFRRRLDQCIHCGLCLPACPTYSINQLEMDSPRGRIALMRAAADGRIDLGGAFQQHIDLCLGCRACETACPSGVQYGLLLETTKAALAGARDEGRGVLSPVWLRRTAASVSAAPGAAPRPSHLASPKPSNASGCAN